jgi:hypothetical protein
MNKNIEQYFLGINFYLKMVDFNILFEITKFKNYILKIAYNFIVKMNKN